MQWSNTRNGEVPGGSSPERGRVTKRISATLGSAAALAAGAWAWKEGFNPADYVDIQDGKITVQPEVISTGINALIAVNDGMRDYAPYVAGAGGAMLAGAWVASQCNARMEAVYRHASVDWDSAVGRGGENGRESTRLERIRRGIGRTLTAAGIVGVATVGMTAAASGLQEDIASGGNRPVEALFDNFAELASAGGEYPDYRSEQTIILQEPESQFMNDTVIDRESLDILAAEAFEQGIVIVPFNKILPNIDNGEESKASIVTSIPDVWFEAVTDASVDESCESTPVILGQATGRMPGEVVNINGIYARVAALANEGIEQMNRDVGVVSDTDMRECLLLGKGENAFGAVVLGGTVEEVQGLLEKNGMDDTAAVITKEQFMENNREFWDKNGTGLLLQQILEITALGGAAMAAFRSGRIQAGARRMGNLHAAGVDTSTFRAVEITRALREAGWATVYGTPVALGLASVSNAIVSGLSAGVGIKEIAVGGALVGTAKAAGSMRAVSKFRNEELELLLR